MPYKESKSIITCPKCGLRAYLHHYSPPFYKCNFCDWDSFHDKTLDIYSGDFESSCLSNLFPYKFSFSMEKYNVSLECASMENFIQSLKIKDPFLQKEFCLTFNGMDCARLKAPLDFFKEKGIVYLNGFEIKRISKEYDEIITRAYDCLYESNPFFREIAIPYASNFYLIHSIGKYKEDDTLLTEYEFISQLKRLISKAKLKPE